MLNSDTSNHSCPLLAVDRRLTDVHEQWHQANASYFDPAQFRRCVQTTIQTLRTVTFILQSHKSLIPNFNSWYGAWQEKFRNDNVMRWMVDARNKIEKEGDLEAHSFVRAEIVASYLDEIPQLDLEVHAELFQNPKEIIEQIPQSALEAHIRNHGILKISRRWIDATLPDLELLEAIAYAYGQLADLVVDAHVQCQLAQTHLCIKLGGRLPSMIGHEDARALHISLANGQAVSFATKSFEPKPGAQNFEERYGIKAKDISKDSSEEIFRSLFRTAKIVMAKDGYHISLMFFFRNNEVVNVQELGMQTQSDKYLLMREIAHEVSRHQADAVGMIGEVWQATPNPATPYMRPSESPDRQECLMGTFVSKAGEPVQLLASVRRKKRFLRKEITTVDETIESEGGAAFIFAPLYKAWGREIPPQWLQSVERAFAKNSE